jgi:tetratricopeptide (TPR) repeat protein
MRRGTGTTTILIAAVAVAWAGANLSGQVTTPQQRISLLNEAIKAFDDGTAWLRSDPSTAADAFRRAEHIFQTLIDSGVQNGRLYYNLGNTQLQLGQVGRAILSYRRAERLIPGDGRLAANLKFARSLRRNQIPESGRSQLLETLFFLHYRTPLRVRFLAGLICYGAFWGVLVLRTWVRRYRLGYVAAVLAVLWITLGCSTLIQWGVQDRRPEGVILANDVVIRKGDGEGYEPQFKQLLHEGVEFVLLEDRGGWYHVQLPDGKEGWIQASQAERV